MDWLTVPGYETARPDPLADAAPKGGRLLLGTVRSYDQWNTTIYSDDDRYRGVKNLRTLVFMNEDDMKDRGVNIVATNNSWGGGGFSPGAGETPADR